MLKQFKTDLKLHKGNLLAPFAVLPLMFALGMGMCAIIVATDVEAQTWFTMGTLMALMGHMITVLIMSLTMAQEFTLALAMGRTRLDFLGAYALRTLLWQGISLALIEVMYALELVVGRALYSQWPLEVEFAFLTNFWVILAALLGGTLLTMFIGGLYSYFGKKALLPLWLLWMAGALTLPRLAENEAFHRFLAAVPMTAWIGLGAAAGVAMVITIVCLGRKQMVR